LNTDKTYRAVRHDVVRNKQKSNADEVHHPKEKTEQINRFLSGHHHLSILELFAGCGNLSNVFTQYGTLEAYDRKLKTGDSFLIFHNLIANKKTYDVVDIDPYGFPNRFFPDIFLLLENGLVFMTMPKPYVNILNGITQQHLRCYFNCSNPSLQIIKEKIMLYGLCHWRKIEFLEIMDLGRLWRFVLGVYRVKATEYCNVKNWP
tara:strand:- start:1696 stop:2307 length:612 start_codon:yes stop_codon:yes gene_type:complete